LFAYFGVQAGVYSSLDEHGPCSAEALAKKTFLVERYLLEWFSANAAMGYITYHEDYVLFCLTPVQAAIFAHEGEPTCMQGLFQGIVAHYATHDVALDVFITGRGRPWEEHPACCFCGTDRFFRPIYVSILLEHWIPSLVGVKEKLAAGATVADIGCGLGSSSILMAKTFPISKIYGYDFHAPSLFYA
jgi:Trans-aconitate methyltransferase